MLTLNVIDQTGAVPLPITGETPTVAVRRCSDSKWLDWLTDTWDVVANYAALGSEHKQVMLDRGDGTYEWPFDQDLYEGAGGKEEEYCVTFHIAAPSVYAGYAADTLSYARDLGGGPKAVTIRVVDQLGNPIQGITLRVKNSAQTACMGLSQTTEADGETPYGFGLEPATSYKVVCNSMGIYSFSNPYTITTAAGTTAETIELEASALLINPPPAGDYCTVYCIVETQGGDPAVGTFNVLEIHHPAKRTEDGEDVTIVHGDDSVALDPDGIGQLAILQGAEVDLQVVTSGRNYSKYRRIVPAAASVNWEDMLAATS